MNNPLGIYLHVPFCESKCAYCEFYSYRTDVAFYDRYTDTLCEHIRLSGKHIKKPVDSIYFGGGTPSLLGGERIGRILNTLRSSFTLKDPEITLEANPADDLLNDFKIMADYGVNRLSLGVQSAVDSELKALSRRHTNDDVIRTAKAAKSVGISNISLDLMLGIPHQTIDSLRKSLDFLLIQEPTHISCYILKIEQNTPFGRADIKSLDLPDDDTVADMYLFTSEYLKRKGFKHYEVSNFAKPGYNSRHNTRYWLCEEYLGLGPSAYSYLNGKRFHFERDTEKYITSPVVIYDDNGGDYEEYCMLRLRLSAGLDMSDVIRFFGQEKADLINNNLAKFKNSDLINVNGSNISLTAKGFLLSNSVISELIF